MKSRYPNSRDGKRQLVYALHSRAQDLTFVASSIKLNNFYANICREISDLVAEIPIEDEAKKMTLMSLVTELKISLIQPSKEQVTERRRRKLSRKLSETLEMFYPLPIEFSSLAKAESDFF